MERNHVGRWSGDAVARRAASRTYYRKGDLQISAAVQPGNSGGPLLDNGGQVVGMVAAKLNALKFAKATGNIPENINFAIKTGAIRDFLDNSAVSYQTADSK